MPKLDDSLKSPLGAALFSIVALAQLLTFPANADAMMDIPVLWYAARSARAQSNWLFGDDPCGPGDRACNRCTPFLSTQLTPDPPAIDIWLNDIDWALKSWAFRWDRTYLPDGLDPSDMYPGDWEAHAQGFVHATPGSSNFYAMSHTGIDHGLGSISLIGGTGGNWILEHSYQTSTSHPSGMFSIGHYIGFVDGPNNLALIDLDHHDWPISIHYGMPTTDPDGQGLDTGGGGVALARLRGGGHLLAVAHNGDAGDIDFFFIDGNIEGPSRKEYLGRKHFGPSQNISLLTECGSGRLFLVTADGDDGLWGGGSWLVSRVDWKLGPDLTLLGAHDIDQSAGSCWPRGGASASVLPGGIVELLSIERDVIEFPTDVTDFWSFCQGSSSVGVVGQY